MTNIVFCSLLCVVKSHDPLESTVLIIPDCHHGVAHEEPLLRHMVLLLHSLIIFLNNYLMMHNSTKVKSNTA